MYMNIIYYPNLGTESGVIVVPSRGGSGGDIIEGGESSDDGGGESIPGESISVESMEGVGGAEGTAGMGLAFIMRVDAACRSHLEAHTHIHIYQVYIVYM